MIEFLDPKVRLQENLLRHVLHVLRTPQDPANQRADALLVAPHEFLERRRRSVLRQPHQFAVVPLRLTLIHRERKRRSTSCHGL